jgi:hypothetical protein
MSNFLRWNSFYRLLIILLFAFSSSCVSVKLGPSEKRVPSKKYSFAEPNPVFKVLNTDFADKAWQSSITANSLVVISECGPIGDQDLKKIALEHFSALQSLEIEKEQTLPYSGREALLTIAKGQVDGVTVKMAVHTVNKNGCNYTITYLGRSEKFAQEISLMESFINGFKIQ